MLIYKGDKFVKGKKFTINEGIYVFNTKDNKDRYIFESIETKEIIKLTEEEARKAETYIKGLSEDVNLENKEINDKIYKALKNRACAEKYKDELEKAGLTVAPHEDYQGSTITGPNGKSADYGTWVHRNNSGKFTGPGERMSKTGSGSHRKGYATWDLGDEHGDPSKIDYMNYFTKEDNGYTEDQKDNWHKNGGSERLEKLKKLKADNDSKKRLRQDNELELAKAMTSVAQAKDKIETRDKEIKKNEKELNKFRQENGLDKYRTDKKEIKKK